MPSNNPTRLKHLYYTKEPQKDRYTSPIQGRSKAFISHITEKDLHGEKLKGQINTVKKDILEIKKERSAKGLREDYGIYIEFESGENIPLRYESLEDARVGIEIENIRQENKKTYVTVYVPDGKVEYFNKKINQYLDHSKYSKKTNQPKNQQLIETINNIHLATLRAFWTGVGNFEDISKTEKYWWEIWIRTGKNLAERNEIEKDFINACTNNSILLKKTKLVFPERTVFLANTSIDILASSLMILNCLAELRNPQESAETFMDMALDEQREWVDNLSRRTSIASGSIPVVCIIDTGVNNGHPLINIALEDSDRLTYDDSWGSNDNDGHGTGMAGIVLYGDLFDHLISSDQIELLYKLESVKLLSDSHSHDIELYGAVTTECIARSETNKPIRKRVFCLAITSDEKRFGGRPTSWSAAIDKVAFGEIEDSSVKRIIFISAGNIRNTQSYIDYPSNNELESIQDPGQSWNSITVGGFTQKTFIDAAKSQDLDLVAQKNELSPSSTTSITWEKKWPIKPEIVLEAGNYVKEKSSNFISNLDSLSLLTTNYKPTEKMFNIFSDTSAAVAQASRIAAIIQFHYRDYWPETLRGLIIHSSDWTNEMLGYKSISIMTNAEKLTILRKYGFGTPSIEKAIWCASNYSTLIVEHFISPYRNDENNDIKTNDVNFHSLPWPKEFFQALSATQIKIKITLSYFIEPNPTHRQHFGKYDYASHGLRFDLRKGTETVDDFKKRINKYAREDNDDTGYSGLHWSLGSNVRNHGSIHSDTWIGSAADISEMDTIAIYPISGWWKTRKRLERWSNSVRYSIIISLETENQEIDIYTPIKNMVATLIPVST